MAQTRSQFNAPQFNARNPQRAPDDINLPDNRPEWYDIAANAHGDQAKALDIPTRALKFNIAVLSAWLGNPAHRLTRDDRIEMRIRLDALRTELHRRGDVAKALHQARANGKTKQASLPQSLH